MSVHSDISLFWPNKALEMSFMLTLCSTSLYGLDGPCHLLSFICY